MLQIQEFSPEIIKAIILLNPMLALLAAFVYKKPSSKQMVGMLLGVLWNVPYLILLNVSAEYFGWWNYAPSENSFYNIPIELLVGWCVLWGAFIPYCFEKANLLIPILIVLVIDLYFMPEISSIFKLGDSWLIGEFVLIISCLIPSILIYNLTVNREELFSRSFIQSLIWGGWNVFLIPAIALHHEGKEIFDIWQLDSLKLTIFFNLIIFAIFIGYSALHELARAGEGTPIPMDPPKYLVTTGPYAYMANPLQISTMLIYISFALAFDSYLMVLAILVFVLYTEIFVKWHHKIDIEKRFNYDWFEYKKNVKNWLPRWLPYTHKKSTVFFSKDCIICPSTEEFAAQLNPKDINFESAKNHPSKDLKRATYRHYSGRFEEEGVNAMARIFEQVNLSFAMIGWIIRMPFINAFLQFTVDRTSVRGKKVFRKSK